MTRTEAQFRNELVKTGLAQVGHLYRDSSVPTNWPPQQFDCSTFTHWLMAMHGIDIDRGVQTSSEWPPAEPIPWRKYPGYTLTQQAVARNRAGSIIPFAAIKPGDFLYYDKPGSHHVVMYIGGGKVVHAAGTSYGVIVSPVVPPGARGFGGKTLTICVSSTRMAAACGYVFVKPPVTPPNPKPPSVIVPIVSLRHILAAAKADIPAKTGHLTYKADVIIVERALYKEGLLPKPLVDGSWGTMTKAGYERWQKRCGYTGSAADGVPGPASLTMLGKKYGFHVSL